ncbi:hypothetical protein LEP48_14735 [Isoptericola sp. NEAU-Y5]|uniref:Peptidase C39-like domain-containing protein n=1 Tax=Isoptericola luteus TaxID=2879484 RepID=A0ABS7ZHU4_9MICO|nr:hypothetical protein [Isoptericola sp. NEAU-Y5]MCA5891760.1 hypothetical protein [Isoptericola sp. NEAU-Y5]MCA5894593.1 hypothetical protein [Isoptericola sp. NEAU-Y5]
MTDGIRADGGRVAGLAALLRHGASTWTQRADATALTGLGPGVADAATQAAATWRAELTVGGDAVRDLARSLDDGLATLRQTDDDAVRRAGQVRHTSFAAPTPSGVGVRTQGAQAAARRWGGDVLTAPEGAPDDVRAGAGEYETTADLLDERADTLTATAHEVTDADAEAGTAAAQGALALADLARLEAGGCRIIAAGLRAYATALDGAQKDHAATSGAAAGAEDALRLALGDAAGHARLAGFAPTGTVTALDAAAALAAGVGDPDKAVVSAAEWAAYLAVRDDLSDAELARFDAVLADARTPEERQAVIAALATGAGLPLALALARRLRQMTPAEVRAVASLGLADVGAGVSGVALGTPDGTDLIQFTGTTCGSASLLLLAAQRDPYLALFLATGETVDGHVPDYLADIPRIDRLAGAGLTTGERLRHVQEQVRVQTNRFTFWPGRWLGSAPWGYGDEVSRILGGQDVDMSYSLLRPKGGARDLVARAVASVDAGTPVPFLVGPSGTDVPRHYVLLVGHSDGELQFYEPGSGEVRSVSVQDAVAGTGPVGAFGNWHAIYGAAVPEG